MERKVLNEITPLGIHDFMYVADRHKQLMDYPIHYHNVMELNFVENAAGCRRVVGDSSEIIEDLDLVLITSADLEHVWEQHDCHSSDIHEITVQFKFDLEDENTPFRTNPFKSICKMMERAKHGLAFPQSAIMTVYHRLTHLSAIGENFMMALELLNILHELSKFDDAHELSSSSYAKVNLAPFTWNAPPL